MKKQVPASTHQLKIGSNIRKWRVLRNVKQKDLALALSLSEAAISNIENDKTSLSVQQMSTIAATLGIPVLHLLSDPGKKIAVNNTENDQHSPQQDNSYLLDSLLTAIEKKDKKFWAMLLKIKGALDKLVSQNS